VFEKCRQGPKGRRSRPVVVFRDRHSDVSGLWPAPAAHRLDLRSLDRSQNPASPRPARRAPDARPAALAAADGVRVLTAESRGLGDKTTIEHWLPHAGTTMMGISHTYDSKRTHFFEFMRIATHRGKIAYIVQPGGDPPVLFRAVTVTEEEAVFENPAHDHPQRIAYVRTEKGMTATISLMDGSKATEFAFERRAE
jgi:hypothetical protein